MYHETHARSIAKAATWRIFGSVATAGIVWAFTGRLGISIAVGTIEFATKIGLFWMHERMWDRILFGKRRIEPAVLWLTGLSGAGKTSIARWVTEALRARGLRVEHLDGDTIRDLFPQIGFSREEREAHIKRVGHLASRLEHHGVFVVASFISPDASARDFVRGLCSNFVEIHVATPLDECERRDSKGLYARARRGELQHFVGIDDPYEAPTDPTLVIDTRLGSVADAGTAVLACLFATMRNQRGPLFRTRSHQRAHPAGGSRELQSAGDALVDR